jgi:hypothetical protein
MRKTTSTCVSAMRSEPGGCIVGTHVSSFGLMRAAIVAFLKRFNSERGGEHLI